MSGSFLPRGLRYGLLHVCVFGVCRSVWFQRVMGLTIRGKYVLHVCRPHHLCLGSLGLVNFLRFESLGLFSLIRFESLGLVNLVRVRGRKRGAAALSSTASFSVSAAASAASAGLVGGGGVGAVGGGVIAVAGSPGGSGHSLPGRRGTKNNGVLKELCRLSHGWFYEHGDALSSQ